MRSSPRLTSINLAALFTVAGALALNAQTLTLGTRSGPDSIDPHFTASGTHAEALKHVFDTLVWSGDGLELEPRLARQLEAARCDDVGIQTAARRQVPRRLGFHRRRRKILHRAHSDGRRA